LTSCFAEHPPDSYVNVPKFNLLTEWPCRFPDGVPIPFVVDGRLPRKRRGRSWFALAVRELLLFVKTIDSGVFVCVPKNDTPAAKFRYNKTRLSHVFLIQ